MRRHLDKHEHLNAWQICRPDKLCGGDHFARVVNSNTRGPALFPPRQCRSCHNLPSPPPCLPELRLILASLRGAPGHQKKLFASRVTPSTGQWLSYVYVLKKKIFFNLSLYRNVYLQATKMFVYAFICKMSRIKKKILSLHLAALV